jgi:hypothetical protein
MPCVKLPPGYTLLERSGDIVLGFNPNVPFGKYATWKVDRAGTGVHSGHYCHDIQIAVAGYVRRAELENKLAWPWEDGQGRANAI